MITILWATCKAEAMWVGGEMLVGSVHVVSVHLCSLIVFQQFIFISHHAWIVKAIVCNCSIVPAEQLRSSRCKGTCPEMLMGQPLIRSLLWKHLLCLRQLSWLASACFCNWHKHSAVRVKALSFYHPWASINFFSTSQFEKVWYAWTSWTYVRHPGIICNCKYI